MSYRRKPTDADKARRYRTFCNEQRDLLNRVHMPTLLIEDQRMFEYFLEHGCLWHGAPLDYSVSKLTHQERTDYVEIARRYHIATGRILATGGLSSAEVAVTRADHDSTK